RIEGGPRSRRTGHSRARRGTTASGAKPRANAGRGTAAAADGRGPLAAGTSARCQPATADAATGACFSGAPAGAEQTRAGTRRATADEDRDEPAAGATRTRPATANAAAAAFPGAAGATHPATAATRGRVSSKPRGTAAASAVADGATAAPAAFGAVPLPERISGTPAAGGDPHPASPIRLLLRPVLLLATDLSLLPRWVVLRGHPVRCGPAAAGGELRLSGRLSRWCRRP